jgi:two-component system, cell cycle response regulator DivK
MSRPLIWVIEDNDQNFELVDFLLGEAGYDVLRARDSDELEPLLAGAPPRLVLLDMNLPSGSGLDLLRHLRREERSPRIPVVALTAHAMRGDRERFLAAGCDGYISKPIEANAFLAAVAGFVGTAAGDSGDTRQP